MFRSRGKRTVSLNPDLNLNEGQELVSDEEPEIYDVDNTANIEKAGFRCGIVY